MVAGEFLPTHSYHADVPPEAEEDDGLDAHEFFRRLEAAADA
jgi:hypothetical protein